MNKIKALKENRADLLKQLETVSAKDNFSADDQAQFDGLNNQIKAVDQQISNLRDVEELTRQSASNQLSDREAQEIAKNYSLARALNGMSAGRITGFEREMHEEAEREARNSGITLAGNPNTLLIPTKVQMAPMFRNDMTAGTADQGGRLIRTELQSLTDYLWDRMVLAGLGARFLTGLTGNLSFPSAATVPSLTWEGETDEGAESSPTIGIGTLSPKRGGTYVDVSNQLLRQTSPSAEGMVAQMMISAIQRGIESAAIAGGGSISGILGTIGIGDVVGGTNGAAPDWADITGLERELAIDNADIGSVAYLTNAKVRSKLKNTSKVSGQNGFVWDDGEFPLNGYRAGVTNLVPSNLVKGDSGAVCSAIIMGNFEDLVIGQWGPIEVLPNPYTKGKSGITEMIINAYVDALVLRPQSFAAMKDALTT
jgi:HK97 family phage major capsid protein